MFTKTELAELMELLARTTLKGHEVLGFLKLTQKIESEMKKLSEKEGE